MAGMAARGRHNLRGTTNHFRAGGSTVISLASPEPTQVKVSVYDVRGRIVRTLYDGAVAQGMTKFNWYGRDNNGRSTASGIYFIRAQSPAGNLTRKVVLLR
jgi:flagellar hook assembly protein FlgD